MTDNRAEVAFEVDGDELTPIEARFSDEPVRRSGSQPVS